MDDRQLGGGIFSQNNDLILIGIERSHQEMISPNRPKAKGLFLLIPLVVTLHDDYTPILDEV